jgi:hypothetical protein
MMQQLLARPIAGREVSHETAAHPARAPLPSGVY